ncbi:site-specific integrase [Dapis sp. BLCC M172]|uniref:site-specific integrase n=1 Tax=Dapis sp. BLCC M172 TaxID=2975281 RepID=UPI003CEFA854
MNARKRGVANFDDDRGRLRISLPLKLVRELKAQGHEVKRYNYTGLEATPQNKVKVVEVVEIINQDLSNPHMAFDPTLKKYFDLLKPKVSSAGKTFVLSSSSVVTVGNTWDDWLKIKEPQIERSTFIVRYGRYTNLLKPFLELPINQETATKIVSYLQSQLDRENAKQCFSQLKQAVSFKVGNGEIGFNPFNYYTNPIKTKSKTSTITDEEDRQAFSREDMETIIKAFYEHPKSVDYAPLIEFLFLTGCRPGEAYALTWDNVQVFKTIKFEHSLSMVTRRIKGTKTNKIRRFDLRQNSRLNNLLIKLEGSRKTAFVFSSKGRPIKHSNLSNRWGSRGKSDPEKHPDIVLNLAKEGKIKQYLKPYAMRHTYISLAANMIAEKYPKKEFLSALQLLADSVGNSIEVISKHYLHITEDVILPSFD